MYGSICFFIKILSLMMVNMANGEGYRTAKTTTVRSPTSSTPSTCQGPNKTIDASCQSQPVCDFGALSPPLNCWKDGHIPTPRCVCARDYVLDTDNLNRCIHASECLCKAPNEEFKTCTSRCVSTCEYPQFNCSTFCGDSDSKCVCKEGYLRNAIGVCIPKNSYECAMAGTTTTTPTTTFPDYRKRIQCYNGTIFVVDCSLYTDYNSKDYKECMEYQKQRENDALQPILCDEGVMQCYDLRHSCYTPGATKHVKGCGSAQTSANGGLCESEVRYRQCPYGGDIDTYNCKECWGNLCNKGDQLHTSTTPAGYRTTTTTAPADHQLPTCQGPNTTLANYSCECQHVCGFGEICPSCPAGVTVPRKCVCAEDYVLDPHNLNRCIHVSECQLCKAPNEEFKTCIESEPSCQYPYRYTKYCRASNAKCVCKEGYLRNAIGVCVPKNSYECASAAITTTPTTSPDYSTRIQCYNGTIFVGNCSWYKNHNSADYKKCLERQNQRENDAFSPIFCDQGVTQCYDLRHNCYTAIVTKHVKGCATNDWGSQINGICNRLIDGQCRDGDHNTYMCGACEGNLCNKGDIPSSYSTTPPLTTVIYRSNLVTMTTTGARQSATSVTKATTTTKRYQG